MIRTASTFVVILSIVAVCSFSQAQERARNARRSSTSETGLQRRTWSINGQDRTALVYVPSIQSAKRDQERTKRPLIFGFHGHGGNSERMVHRYRFPELWPEAVVIYPQGLKTRGKTDPQGKKPGWQNAVGIEDDRDLIFFDAMLQSMIDDHQVDPKRVYLSGHSNGAGFSYLLLAARNSKVAAIGVSAGGGRGLRNAKNYEARPVLHIAGRNDPVVPFSSQERTLQTLIKLNNCEHEPKTVFKNGLRYLAKDRNADIIFWPHDGTHAYPEKAPELIIRFLQRVALNTPSAEKEPSPKDEKAHTESKPN